MRPATQATPSIFLAIAIAIAMLACSRVEYDDEFMKSPTPRTNFVNATRVPTVTPSPTAVFSTAASTAEQISGPTSATTLSPLPKPTSKSETLSEREVYCRDHALPTATPEPSESPTPIPTLPPGIAESDLPAEWITKMDEIEAWVREIYEVDETQIAEFHRRFVSEDVWRGWRADSVEDWSDDQNSTMHLWEQINRTLTLFPPGVDYTEFIADDHGDRYIGFYIPETRTIIFRFDSTEFDLETEWIYLHEYAHHVQYEKFDVDHFHDCFHEDDDAHNALRALIEGDAVFTQIEYIEDVIGWERFESYYDETESEDGDTEEEPLMARYLDELDTFTYGTGLSFVWDIALPLDCIECEPDRQKIDALFRKPPYTTEQIYHPSKYFSGEGRQELILPNDMLREEWSLRSASTIGKNRWVALLATLTDAKSDDIESELPGWGGDYAMLFENDQGRALNLRVAAWQNDRYVQGLIEAFDGSPRLAKVGSSDPVNRASFEEYHLWENDSGAIALAFEIEPVYRFFFMFLAVGPDIETVTKTVHKARDRVTLFGEHPFDDERISR